jgi:hypothetical protein
MTPAETARWFRRSVSWLRRQPHLLRLGTRTGQPLFHIQACRAFVLGRIAGLTGDKLLEVQFRALARAAGVDTPAATGLNSPDVN